MIRRIFLLLLLGLTQILHAQETADHGFIHPGGLHTQADFDRVKAQIAAKNQTVVKAWNKLKSAEYAQANVQTYPVETIVRGGGSGENYINAARGATMAYQNALRWKIGGTAANAKAAVRILMAWANKTTAISGKPTPPAKASVATSATSPCATPRFGQTWHTPSSSVSTATASAVIPLRTLATRTLTSSDRLSRKWTIKVVWPSTAATITLYATSPSTISALSRLNREASYKLKYAGTISTVPLPVAVWRTSLSETYVTMAIRPTSPSLTVITKSAPFAISPLKA